MLTGGVETCAKRNFSLKNIKRQKYFQWVGGAGCRLSTLGGLQYTLPPPLEGVGRKNSTDPNMSIFQVAVVCQGRL